MTTIEIVAACIAAALYLVVIIILRSVSRIGIASIPRKPPPLEPKQIEEERADQLTEEVS